MNWLTRWLSGFRNSTAANPASWFVEWIRGGVESDSGVAVNARSALGYAPVWYAVNKLGGHVGQLPIELREMTRDGGSRQLTKHPAYWLMAYQPNELMTPSVFRETMQQHAMLWGNGRAAIHRNGRKEPAELLLLLPDQTITVMVNGMKWHVWTDKETQEKTKIKDIDVVHIPGLGYDGISGYSVIEYAKNSIGMGLAAERHINKHFKNNAVPSLILEAPPGVFRNQEEASAFLARWNDYHTGLDNANKAGLLREGIKASTLGANGRDAQWLEERVFQRQEAALWFLLEQILGDNSSVSYNSLEQKNMAYVTNCLMRWLIKWEEELARKLLTRSEFETGRFYWKFKTAGLLRGTTKERYEVYQIARQIEVMSANDVRSLEDMPPIDGGDEYENPATSSGVNDTAIEEPDDDPTARVAALAETAIRSRLDGFASVERQRIVEAADKRAMSFLSWLDEFYDDFLPRIEQGILSCGGDANDVQQWIETSKHLLLEASGRATPAQLRSIIIQECEAWQQRSGMLAKTLVERSLCAKY
jgi:HK97 family phage portal protein